MGGMNDIRIVRDITLFSEISPKSIGIRGYLFARSSISFPLFYNALTCCFYQSKNLFRLCLRNKDRAQHAFQRSGFTKQLNFVDVVLIVCLCDHVSVVLSIHNEDMIQFREVDRTEIHSDEQFADECQPH